MLAPSLERQLLLAEALALVTPCPGICPRVKLLRGEEFLAVKVTSFPGISILRRGALAVQVTFVPVIFPKTGHRCWPKGPTFPS